MDRRLPAPAIDVPSTRRGTRVDRERHHKLQQLRREGREPFPDVHLRSRSLAATIYASHDPRTLDPGEHGSWRYVVAGRLVARRKHRHATFFDVRDQSGVVELCARRDLPNHAKCSQLLSADIGDIVAAEGIVYVTDNHKLTLSVLASRLLTKALRSPPARTNGVTTANARSRQREVDLLADERARTQVKTRSAMTASIREWMRQNLFIEVEGALPQLFADGAEAELPAAAHSDPLSENVRLRSSSRLYLRRCLLSGLERVYELNKCFGSVRGPHRNGPDATALEWSAAYIDSKESARQAENVILHAAAAIVPEMRVLWHGSSIDLRSPWRSTTVRQGILERCGLDILAADSSVIARHLPSVTCAGENSWASLVNQLYARLLEPQLIDPTIVYDFPLAGRALVRRHPIHDDLAEGFRVVIGGVEVGSGDSELNDPQELSARLAAQKSFVPGENDRTAAYREEEVRLLEYGLYPAATARLEIDRLLMLLSGSDTVHDVVPLPLLASLAQASVS
jgi:lysyl-tRNA synthetase class 2